LRTCISPASDAEPEINTLHRRSEDRSGAELRGQHHGRIRPLLPATTSSERRQAAVDQLVALAGERGDLGELRRLADAANQDAVEALADIDLDNGSDAIDRKS